MRTKLPIATILVGLALTVGACGSSSDSSSTSAGTDSTAAGAADTTSASGAAFVEEAKAALARDEQGTDRELPKSGPKGIRGKKVFAIPCSASAPGCQLTVEAFREAGKQLGWDVTIADGKGTPAGQSAAIDAAIAAKADAIVPMTVDCADTKAALERAKAAGVKIYAISSIDCDDPQVGAGKALFDSHMPYAAPGKDDEWMAGIWTTVADYIIARTDGKAKVLQLTEKQPVVVDKYGQAFSKAIAKCTTCKVYETTITLDDLFTNKVEPKVSAALSAHPDVDVVMAPYDAMIQLGVANAVQQARAGGRKIILTGLEGFPTNLDLIKKGVQDMVPSSQPLQWWGWSAVDGLNRLFAGEEQVDAGIGHQAITKDNLPADIKAGYNGNPKSSGYKDNYKRIWGVS